MTGEDPNIEGKIPVVTRPKLTEKEKQLPYSDLGNVKKYSNILMSPSEFHGKESPETIDGLVTIENDVAKRDQKEGNARIAGESKIFAIG